MIILGNEALRTRQDSAYLTNFSKMWDSGDTVVTYYSTARVPNSDKMDIIVGTAWGHKVDLKKMGMNRTFIKSNAKIENNKPVTTDALARISRIAPAYLEGEYLFEKKMLLEGNMPQPTREKKLKELELKFKDKDKKTENPVVGPLTYTIVTECLVVPLNSDKSPNVEEARLCSQELSNKKLEGINIALNDDRMVQHPERGYVELQYTFGSSRDKKQDGQVAPTGTPAGSELETKYPDAWIKLKEMVKTLPKDSDQIIARNRSLDAVPEDEIVAAFSAYAVEANPFLNYLDDSDKKMINRLKNNADLLKELKFEAENEEVRAAIEAVDLNTNKAETSKTARLLQKEVNDAIKDNDEERDESLIDSGEENKVEENKEVKNEEPASDPLRDALGI